MIIWTKNLISEDLTAENHVSEQRMTCRHCLQPIEEDDTTTDPGVTYVHKHGYISCSKGEPATPFTVAEPREKEETLSTTTLG